MRKAQPRFRHGQDSRTTNPARGRRQRPFVECLEDRVVPATETFTTNPGLAIPDLATVTSTLNVTTSAITDMTDVNVLIRIDHTWQGDLSVEITDGVNFATLIDRVGFTGSGFGYSAAHFGSGGVAGPITYLIIDDEGATDGSNTGFHFYAPPSGTANIAGNWQPDRDTAVGFFTGAAGNRPLSNFDTGGGNRTWTLTVRDHAGGDTGTLISWGVVYTGTAIIGETSVRINASGNLEIRDINGGTSDDRLTISADFNTSEYVVSDPTNMLGTDIPTATGNGTNVIRVPFAAVTGTQIILDTLAGNDDVTFDFASGSFLPSGGFVLDSGAGTSDRLFIAADTNFTLTDTSINITGFGSGTLANLEEVNLTGGSGANSFDVSGWTGQGTMDGAGGTDTIVSAANANFILTDASLAVAGHGTLTLSQIEVANLSGGSAANSFTITGWSGSGVLNGLGSTTDAVIATNDVNFTLTDSSLTRSGLGTMNLIGIEVATLTGGNSPNLFDVSGWTQGGTLNGAGASDTLVATNNVDFTLADNRLTRSGGFSDLNLASVEVANLSGDTADNHFNVSGWTGTGLMDGRGGAGDAIVATNNLNFTLTDTTLARSGLNPVNLTNIEAANLTGGLGNNLFDISGWTGVGLLDGVAATVADRVVATNDLNFQLSDGSLGRSGRGTVNLANIGAATLTGGAGDNVFDVSGWTGSGLVDGLGHVSGDMLTATNDTNFTITNTSLSQGGSAFLSFVNIEQVSLTGGTSDNSFDISLWTAGNLLLDGQAGFGDTILATNDTNFTLSDGSLARTGFVTVNFLGMETAALTGGAGDNVFDISGWTGGGTLDGLGESGAGDRVVAAADADFRLSDGLLQRGSFLGAFTLSDIEVANLTGGASDNLFDVSGWTGTGTLDAQGHSFGDIIFEIDNVDYVLSDAALARGGRGTLTLANFESASLTGGLNQNSFTISGWTGPASIDGAGGTTDRIVAINDVAAFILDNGFLDRGAGFGLVSLTGVEVALLTGGAGANSFDVSGWTGTGTLNGLLGSDTLTAVDDVNFTLANNQLGRSGRGTLSLVSIENATLTGGPGDNSFTVTSWTFGTANLDGQGGTDTVIAANDTSYTLTDTQLRRTGVLPVNLASIEHATLTGGVTNNLFTLTGWSGTATLDGQGGTDQVLVTSDSDFILSDTLLTRSTAGNLQLRGFESATLTGGASANRFELTGWSGTATLDGQGAGDAYFLQFRGMGAVTTTIRDTGTSGTDTLQARGTANNDVLTLLATRLTLGTEVIDFRGLERLTVDAGDGDDVINARQRSLDRALAAVVLIGGLGNDRFNVSPTTASLFVDGGDPTAPALPGDTLNLVFSGATVSSARFPRTGSGNFTFRNRRPLSFVDIETGAGGLPRLLP